MTYQLLQKDIVVATDKKWLKRHDYHSMAIKLYGELSKGHKDLSDSNLANLCSTSLTTLKEAKRQLVYSGLLEVHKINSTTIIMVLGDKAIRAYAHKIASKEHQRVLRKTIEQMELPNSPDPVEEEDNYTAIYTEEDMANLAHLVQKPKPIDLTTI